MLLLFFQYPMVIQHNMHVRFQFVGELDEPKFNMFMSTLLQNKAKDLYRCKGVLKFKGTWGSSAVCPCSYFLVPETLVYMQQVYEWHTNLNPADAVTTNSSSMECTSRSSSGPRMWVSRCEHVVYMGCAVAHVYWVRVMIYSCTCSHDTLMK